MGATRPGEVGVRPKAHQMGLLLRDTYLPGHTSDVTTVDSGRRVTALPQGCCLAGARVSCAGTAIPQRGRTGYVGAAEEEEEVALGISHTSNTNMIHEDPTAAGTERGRCMASLSSMLPLGLETIWMKRTKWVENYMGEAEFWVLRKSAELQRGTAKVGVTILTTDQKL